MCLGKESIVQSMENLWFLFNPLSSAAYWVMQADLQAAANVERAIAAVEARQLGQRKSFKPQNVKQAWQRLHK